MSLLRTLLTNWALDDSFLDMRGQVLVQKRKRRQSSSPFVALVACDDQERLLERHLDQTSLHPLINIA